MLVIVVTRHNALDWGITGLYRAIVLIVLLVRVRGCCGPTSLDGGRPLLESLSKGLRGFQVAWH